MRSILPIGFLTTKAELLYLLAMNWIDELPFKPDPELLAIIEEVEAAKHAIMGVPHKPSKLYRRQKSQTAPPWTR